MAVSTGHKNQSAFKNINSQEDPVHDFTLPERKDSRVRSSPFDILERNEENEMDASEMSELDYLAQTQFSNNLMGGDQNARSRMFPHVSAPSIEGDFAKSNISSTSNIALTKRTNNLFTKMDDAESLALTPEKDSNSESWMKSILTNKERTTDSQITNGDKFSSNPLSQLKARIRE